MKPFTALLLAGVLALAGCQSGDAPSRRAVFLIVVDTLRPDRLSCYGYEGHSTPNIDRLAGRGTLYERVQSAASWTVPSMGTMMTSRYPTQLGLIERPVEQNTFHSRERREQVRYTPAANVLTLAEVLEQHGFTNTAFVNQPFLNTHDGFTQGFGGWCYPDFEGAVWHDLPMALPSQTRLPIGLEGGQADALIVDEFIRWMADVPDGDVFVWLHLLRPHSPYMPDARYRRPGEESPSDLYDAEIRQVDQDIGRIVDAIDRAPGFDNAIIVFTSDHGEEFGEHGGLEHGHSLHAEVTRIPLIVVADGVPAGRAGCPVGAVDIMPTVLDLVGVEVDAGVQGASVVDVLSGDCGDRVMFAEGMLYAGTERSLGDGRWRLLFDSERSPPYALYDIRQDPAERSDVAAVNQSLVDEMRVRLGRLHERFAGDLYAEVAGDSEGNSKEDERVINSLRALGYIK